MFWASSRPSSAATTAAVAASALPSELGDSSAVGRGWAERPYRDQPHCYHHVPTVNQRPATAVIELLMMGMRMPETCWAVFKRQVINLWNCCIWLVDSFECMMMHGLADLKFSLICFEWLCPSQREHLLIPGHNCLLHKVKTSSLICVQKCCLEMQGMLRSRRLVKCKLNFIGLTLLRNPSCAMEGRYFVLCAWTKTL
jgi:hypothetical protein